MKSIIRYFVLIIVLICFNEARSADNFSDGPYIFWEDGLPVAVTIQDSQVFRDTLSADDQGEFLLDWSDGKAEPIVLTKNFEQPATSPPKPDKFLALSDMHGNLDGTIELLLAAGVMDENYNWIYDGCLIMVGDVLDRGEYTTECLWLLYHLYSQTVDNPQNKLIPILGNHETMTIRKRTHEMDGKYGRTCELLDMTYNELYGENTLFGSWIRNWQTILKLDDLLFVHGGISTGFAQKYKDLDQVNTMIWDYYHDSEAIQDTNLDYLFRTNGPFWYRGYFYSEDKWDTASPEIIDGILNEYSLENIIVGHTTFKNIQYAQEGRIIAIDAGLKYQESGQALLYQDNSFFVLAPDGTISKLKP
ncbi:MAG: metallophosphoesterase [Candidatus Stygibacter australis]|nr:metallophosphoesterase [Candidatus Stygibacter australis]